MQVVQPSTSQRCSFVAITSRDGITVYRCQDCQRITRPTKWPASKIYATCPVKKATPTTKPPGPGTRLRQLIARADKIAWYFGLSLKPSEGCNCESLANQMDAWGVAGCEEHHEEIIAALVANSTHTGIPESIRRLGAAELLRRAFQTP